mgnify:CR=1 FL=1|jgi:dihydroorotase
MNRIPVCIFDPSRTAFENGYLFCDGDDVLDVRTDSTSPGGLYICPGLIDSHAHVYPGVTELGVCADDVGIAQGVHLVVDAGSAGAITLPCFRDVIAPACGTQIKAFLHISKIGFVTKQPYADPRFLDAGLAADTIRRDTGGFLVGLKVCSSGTIVENVGLAPLEQTVRAAELAGCRMMVHLAEGPPSNGQTLPMLRRGDIITHVFHGAFLREASLRANRGAEPLQEYCKLDNLLWDSRGAPVKELEQAIERGVRLDVGHGAASFDKEIAARVIAAGFRDFSISTDVHVRNISGVVRGMPDTISKFLALGMTLPEVIRSVTVLPAENLGLKDWCGNLQTRATIFRLRPVRADDVPLTDAYGREIETERRFESAAVIRKGKLQVLNGAAAAL